MQFLTEEHGNHEGDYDADSNLPESEVQGIPDCLQEDLIGEETNVVVKTNPLWGVNQVVLGKGEHCCKRQRQEGEENNCNPSRGNQ